MSTSRTPRIVLIAGPAVALTLSAATSQVRDQLDATNVGIALALVVAAAALVSRIAGLATAVVAALSFNFFHAEPYHSLRIHDARDVAIVALLAALGVVISDISAWRRRRDVLEHVHSRAVAAPQSIGELLDGVHPVGAVWPAVVDSILDELSVAQCGLVHEQPPGLPLIRKEARQHPASGETFVLPAKGASVAVEHGDQILGYLVVMPPVDTTALVVHRQVLTALADHVAIALTYGRASNEAVR